MLNTDVCAECERCGAHFLKINAWNDGTGKRLFCSEECHRKRLAYATENPSMYEITKEVFDMKHCDACHSDLQKGWEVKHDQDYNLNFCDRSCADEYYYNNPDALVDSYTHETYTVDEVLSTKTL